MKLKILLFFFFIFKISPAQDIIYINELNDINNIKNDNLGKVILINFWATWCKPCVEEFPELIKINKNFSEKDFKIILISLDFKEEIESKLKPFLSQHKINFPIYYLNLKSPERVIDYMSSKWDGGIPATFIFDKSGNLTNFILGSRDYDFFEKEILKIL